MCGRQGEGQHLGKDARHDTAWHVQQIANNMAKMEITTDRMLKEEAAGRDVT